MQLCVFSLRLNSDGDEDIRLEQLSKFFYNGKSNEQPYPWDSTNVHCRTTTTTTPRQANQRVIAASRPHRRTASRSVRRRQTRVELDCLLDLVSEVGQIPPIMVLPINRLWYAEKNILFTADVRPGRRRTYEYYKLWLVLACRWYTPIVHPGRRSVVRLGSAFLQYCSVNRYFIRYKYATRNRKCTTKRSRSSFRANARHVCGGVILAGGRGSLSPHQQNGRFLIFITSTVADRRSAIIHAKENIFI